MLDDFKQTIPFNVLKMKETYKKMRKSESDLFKMKLSESSLDSYLNYSAELKKSRTLNTTDMKFNNYNFNPNVIFISSKVSCSYVS